jgi:uncharacterized protein (TIGR03086 family)
VARLSRERELLGSAVSYALTEATLVTPQLLSSPTPCPGWDLAMLLDHVVDSIRVLHKAITTEGICAGPAPGRAVGPRFDPVTRLRRETARLLAASAAHGSADGAVSIGDRELTARLVTVAGAIEIAVHGWDISVACGGAQVIPSSLAVVLLPIAPLLITAETRPGLFADPVRLARPAGPGDELVAFLGRRPRLCGPEPRTATPGIR